MSAITSTLICNMALTHVGGKSITSLSDTSTEGQICNLNYASARDSLLCWIPWNDAIKRVSIAADAVAPAFDYSRRFLVPGDCLRILQVGEDPDFHDSDHRREGNYILSEDLTLKLVYVSQVQDTSLFTPLFAETLSLYLAWRISFKLNQNLALRKQLWDDFMAIKAIAGSVDGKEDSLRVLRSTLFTDARDTFPRGIQDRSDRDR